MQQLIVRPQLNTDCRLQHEARPERPCYAEMVRIAAYLGPDLAASRLALFCHDM